MAVLTKAKQFKAAQLLRLAENNGAKTLGNTWYALSCFYANRQIAVTCLHAFHNVVSIFESCNFWWGIMTLMPSLHYWFGSGCLDEVSGRLSCGLFCNQPLAPVLPTTSTQRTTIIKEAGKE